MYAGSMDEDNIEPNSCRSYYRKSWLGMIVDCGE